MQVKMTMQIEADIDFLRTEMGFVGETPEELLNHAFEKANPEMPNVLSKSDLSWCRTGNGVTVKLTAEKVEA